MGLPCMVCFIINPRSGLAQSSLPRIEPCPCMIKTDPVLLSQCRYLIVPGNWQHLSGGRSGYSYNYQETIYSIRFFI